MKVISKPIEATTAARPSETLKALQLGLAALEQLSRTPALIDALPPGMKGRFVDIATTLANAAASPAAPAPAALKTAQSAYKDMAEPVVASLKKNAWRTTLEAYYPGMETWGAPFQATKALATTLQKLIPDHPAGVEAAGISQFIDEIWPPKKGEGEGSKHWDAHVKPAYTALANRIEQLRYFLDA